MSGFYNTHIIITPLQDLQKIESHTATICTILKDSLSSVLFKRVTMPRTKKSISPKKILERHTPEFEDLRIIMMTYMVYANVTFKVRDIFKQLKVELRRVDAPLTKKFQNVDRRKVRAPYGTIVSKRLGNEIDGLDLRNSRKKAPEINPMDKLPRKKQKKIDYFRNEAMIVLFLDDYYVNIMLFKDRMKIAGCRKEDDAFEAVMLLWDHIKDMKSLEDDDEKVWSFSNPSDTEPEFLGDIACQNRGFRLGFKIDRQKLNVLMNSSRFKDFVLSSKYESTNRPNVNIKIQAAKPQHMCYNVLCMPEDEEPYFKLAKTNPYATKKAIKPSTLIIFASSETILSGRYPDDLRKKYKKFIKAMDDYRDKIEMKCDEAKLKTLKVNSSKILEMEKYVDD